MYHMKKGFTLIELLVVISIIAVLLSILMPALSKAKEHTRRIICATNLKTSIIAVHIYASQNDDKMPQAAEAGWLQDLQHTLAGNLIQNGCVRENFYCPSDTKYDKNADNEIFWHFSNGGNPSPTCKDDSDLFNCPYFAVSGYFWLIDTDQGRSQQPMGTNAHKWVRKVTCPQPSSTELITDSLFSDGTDYDSNYAEVHGGLWAWGIADRTNHPKGSTKAAGGNIGFVDGHTKWRRFEYMQHRWMSYPLHWW